MPKLQVTSISSNIPCLLIIESVPQLFTFCKAQNHILLVVNFIPLGNPIIHGYNDVLVNWGEGLMMSHKGQIGTRPKQSVIGVLKPFFALICHKINDYIMFKYQVSKTMSSDSQQMEYTPDHSACPDDKKPLRRLVKIEEKDPNSSIEGKWTKEENVKYVLFMDYHTTIFSSKEKRKSLRIFKSLAAFLGTRTARQCRSHFQKIMNKFKKLSKVKQHYQQLIGPAQYHNQLEQLSQILKASVVKVQEEKRYVSESVQTDPLSIKLLDLPNEEIIRLMNLLNVYYRSQYVDWSLPYACHPSQNTLNNHLSQKEE